MWFPYDVALAGGRTHADVLRELAPRRGPGLRAAVEVQGLRYPPTRLTLVGLKQERTLEVWASGQAGWTLLRSYSVLVRSGSLGPKLREGDLQVPEGIYRLTAFNPNSKYHLSIRVGYPNKDDEVVARAEGRTRLGGDIFIHGKAVSIGCPAIGDAAIEELYLLLAHVGLRHTKLILAPSNEPIPAPDAPIWVQQLYARLHTELRTLRTGSASQ